MLGPPVPHQSPTPHRLTTQDLAPARGTPAAPGAYELHPSHPLPQGSIHLGFAALAERLPAQGTVVIDGDPGILWEDLRVRLDSALQQRDAPRTWTPITEALLPEEEIERRLAPFLGGEDPIFGTRFTGSLGDFFDPSALARGGRPPGAPPTAGLWIVYGCGAALAPAATDPVVMYVELPKNEQQFRARAGVPTNLGRAHALPAKAAYKRSYFVDWPALRAHKRSLAARIDLFVDGQRPEEPTFTTGSDLRAGLADLATHPFRVRPWFEPGPWGGQWCRRHFPELPPAPNYAWSFELIVPENGLTFRDALNLRLEVSFDWLMFGASEAILGDSAAWFGEEFPIRFDFLDTVEGGNLSLQVHPSPEYIRQHFGERFTQDETYYILDAEPGATVNVGFQPDVDPAAFQSALEHSFRTATPFDADRFVQALPARRHDLFLIPHGTVHGAGTGNLVLEISATPYIFTFKLHDWLRPDLDGRPRPLNVERGMANLDFSRQGDRVRQELVSHPIQVATGEGWTLEHLPTHPDHFYAVFRYEVQDQRRVEVVTDGSFHALSLVEGRHVEVTTADGRRRTLSYAETLVVPAATGSYALENTGGGKAILLLARMKPPAQFPGWMSTPPVERRSDQVQ